MDATKSMFSSRLLRKAYRPGRRHQGCPVDVYECEKEFMHLVHISRTQQPMDRAEWHRLCNEFSDKWEHICHWVHPGRLADSLTRNFELVWTGTQPPAPVEKHRAKSHVKAQRFKCSECDVICNSFAQYLIHSQGSRHRECVQYKARAELLRGNPGYVTPGAIPLDTILSEPNPQAYYVRSECSGSSFDDLKFDLTSNVSGSTTPPTTNTSPDPYFEDSDDEADLVYFLPSNIA
eukprot:TRINITY_DN948_c0_g2_i1.p1 TRINITY_DN948_c0_g2~~TRINITY_DN948_c0_g2_i1.p1  ORF type:complete len:234 (+),score=41.35 TRINITY_DN948_c0_g2_i1:125-826(+)